jgi:sugar lactone lactonase YvrE
MQQAVIAYPCAAILGEMPVWSMREQALYWVDIRMPCLHRLYPARAAHHAFPMPELCAAAVPTGGGLVVALLNSLAHFDPATGVLSHLVDIEPASLGNRLNEARCDRTGRLWVGSMRDFGAAVTGSLYMVDADLQVTRVLRDIRIPNALGWSPDGDILYFADTGDRHLRRYAFDPAAVTLDNPSTLLSGDAPGRPDGCAIDAEGFIWNARYGAGCVVRISPQGDIVETLFLPTSQPTCCALGGPDLKTLYITTARQKLSAVALAREPEAGHLFSYRVEVPGIPESEFRFTRATATLPPFDLFSRRPGL